MPKPALSMYATFDMSRTMRFFPAPSRLLTFSRRALLSSPRTIRPFKATTETPSISLFVKFMVTFDLFLTLYAVGRLRYPAPVSSPAKESHARVTSEVLRGSQDPNHERPIQCPYCPQRYLLAWDDEE